MNVSISGQWYDLLVEEFEKQYFLDLKSFVRLDRRHKMIYPPSNMIFNAFTSCPFEELKVVILGQDPYHAKGQANGLSFSVPIGLKEPPSLQNIFKELRSDLGYTNLLGGDLTPWSKQGVFLLNTTLTVEEGKPGSHQNKGWELFTDKVIQLVSERKENIAFVLWGSFARSKKYLINESRHFVIESAHPSPFSAYRGFFGSKPFSKVNSYLRLKKINQINW